MTTSEDPRTALRRLFETFGAETVISDEMHRLRSIRFDDPDLDVGRLIDLMDVQPGFDQRLGVLEGQLVRLLAGRDQPHPHRLVLGTGKDWRYLPEDPAARRLPENRPRDGRSLNPGWAFTLGTSAVFSDAWFAAALCRDISFYRNTSAEARPQMAFRIGHLLATWQSRVHFYDVGRGKKTKASAGKGGQTSAAAHAARRNAILDEMRPLVESGHSVSRAADIVACRGLGTSREANRALWKRHA